MLASASHFKHRIVAMALTVLSVPPASAAEPVFLPDIAPLSAFPDPSHATRREGVFLPPETVRLLTPGMTKRQIHALLGVPHFHEGFFGVRQWNYILNFYTGSGTAYRICRLQLRWDRRMRLEGMAWSAEDCRAAVYPVTEKVEAVPPTQAPPIRSASVYFDFARSDLGEAAQRDLTAFAASAAGSGRNLSIVGYTDSAGPDAYNDRLSLMRADAVARTLVSLGVPSAKLQISGAGERSPALKTADGMAEPMNRRTVVTIMPN